MRTWLSNWQSAAAGCAPLSDWPSSRFSLVNCWVNPLQPACTDRVGRNSDRAARTLQVAASWRARSERSRGFCSSAIASRSSSWNSGGVTGNESLSADLLDGDRRLDAHAAEQLELRLVLELRRAEQGDVRLALDHFGLADVEQGGLSDLIARLRQGEEVDVADHLLPGDIHLRGGLQRVQVLGGDVRAKIDAGPADVLVGGALQRLLLPRRRRAPGRRAASSSPDCTPR